MRNPKAAFLILLVVLTGCGGQPQREASPSASTPQTTPAALATDPLPSWNAGLSKTAITDFVMAVTTTGSPDFVPEAERIATFDNDGTLWAEQPMYFQVMFVIDRIKAMAVDHPDWKTKQPYRAILENDMKALAASGEKGILQLMGTTHTGMTIDEFNKIAKDWIASARHPTTKRPYTAMIFQPMLEVMWYLRANGFKTFIVSGGGVEFMRAWVEPIYGIPPEQVVGSRGKLKYDVQNGTPVILKLPEIDLIDDGPGKPVGIAQVIGRRPIAAFGNSDGDFQMIEYTTGGSGRRLGAIVHHTDAEREWAYDRDSHIGKLARGLDEAPKRGWVLIDMKNEWNAIYPPAAGER